MKVTRKANETRRDKMTEQRPKQSWDKYKKKAGQIPCIVKHLSPYDLEKLDYNAPDDVKLDFEKYQNDMFRGCAMYHVPDMKEPYYTWEGKVVERSSLADRELPLVD